MNFKHELYFNMNCFSYELGLFIKKVNFKHELYFNMNCFSYELGVEINVLI